MLNNKIGICLASLLLSFNVMGSLKLNEEEFSHNTVSVTSVSENFANNVRELKIEKEESFNNLFKKNCSQEIIIFCQNKKISSYECMKKNFNLITGQCRLILQEEFKKGISYDRLSIHDLKLTSDTLFLGSKKGLNFSIGIYKSLNAFDYRDLRFRKGFVKVRNYKYKDYNGQFVIYSAKLKNIFTDNAGISYNPHFQSGEFFFDDKGNVTVGTLSKNYEYKPHILLKKGTVVAFSNDRKLKRGILAKAVRIGKCGFLSGMEINDEKIVDCKQ